MHELSLSVESSQEAAGGEHHSSQTSSTTDQPAHSTASSASSGQHPPLSLEDIESSAIKSPAYNNHDAADPVFDDSTRGDGICQTFKMDKGAMRPRQPADMYKKLSPTKRSGYVANRRSATFIIHEDGGDAVDQLSTSQIDSSQVSIGESSATISTQALRRTSSMVKLSFDSEGKAEVMARTGNTPSPPRAASFTLNATSHRRGLGLHRSLSAVETGGSNALGQQYSLGRSKDARTWEFYCDADAREALNKQAEREENGSASAAIGLIRSRSNNNKPLLSNSNKRNAHVQKLDSAKRHKSTVEKVSRKKLERATSSVARLQTTNGTAPRTKSNKTRMKHSKSNSQSALVQDLEGDSDKENWQPGTQRRPQQRRRPATSEERARALLDNLREPTQSSRMSPVRGKSGSRRRQEPKLVDKENAAPVIDDEVAAFMRDSNLSKEEEDLDCVQNLLSLSQATWM